MDKFVKLSAIEQMAKPMKAFHEGEEEYEDTCECPNCGHKYSHGSEMEDEYEEED